MPTRRYRPNPMQFCSVESIERAYQSLSADDRQRIDHLAGQLQSEIYFAGRKTALEIIAAVGRAMVREDGG